MSAKITNIAPDSPASKTIIEPGYVLRRINGKPITDILDYQYYSCNSRLLLELHTSGGDIKLVRIRKPEGEDLGLEFETQLMDKQRSCINKCIFCFIDQLPKGMRKSLYYKDDDVRLSFLQGNYVTLTNLCDKDIERIIRLRISPINISIHTLDPSLRLYMLGKQSSKDMKNSLLPRFLEYPKKLACAGIMLNCQVVCCPGVNDGSELTKTIKALMKLGASIDSVSIVPVGLTKHREGLTELKPFNKELALRTVRQVEYYGDKCLEKRGSRVFYPADELFMLAGLELPPDSYYEDYPQLENGVGMMRLFITEFEEALQASSQPINEKEIICSVATGVLAAPQIEKLLQTAAVKYGRIRNCLVYAITNSFFGEVITVSGLITGGDFIEQLKGKELGDRLLIPQNMLRHNDNVFLDDITIDDVSNALGVQVMAVKLDGREFLKALL